MSLHKHFLAGAFIFLSTGSVLAQTQTSGALEALNDPDVQVQLNMTDYQVQQLDALMQQAQGELDRLNNLAQHHRLEAIRRYRNFYRYTLQQGLRTLNPMQQRMFRQLTGQGPLFNPAISSPTR